MKGRLLIVFAVMTVAAAACAGPDLVGGDDARGSESVTNDAQSDATSQGDQTTDNGSATEPGAVSDESVAGDQTTEEEPAPGPGDRTPGSLSTVTTAPKTAPTPAPAATPAPEGTVPASVANGDFVATAKADLADRLNIDAGAIAVVSVQEVDWPDRSIGCPQPDMVYAQVITNGSRIILSHNGIAYHYHSAGTGDPFYCANPSNPVPGSEV